MGIGVNVWVKFEGQNIEVPGHYEQIDTYILGRETPAGVSTLVPDAQEGYEFVRVLGDFPEWTMFKVQE